MAHLNAAACMAIGKGFFTEQCAINLYWVLKIKAMSERHRL